MVKKEVFLYSKKDGADKVYQLQLVAKEGGFVVNYQNGKRGSTLRFGTRTETPVGEAEATKIYESVLKSKLKDGYTENESGTAYAGSEMAGNISGFIPQLLGEIKNENALEIMLNNRYVCIEEKKDGEHRTVRKTDESVQGINKLGFYTALPQVLVDAVKRLKQAYLLIDGEQIGDHLYVFDVLEDTSENGELIDLRGVSYEKRIAYRSMIVEKINSPYVHNVESVVDNKKAYFEKIKKDGGEGVVLKLLTADFTQGKKHGDQFKWKFYKECCVIAGEQNSGKRSVQMYVYDKSKALIFIGNVTIPVNMDIPKKGDIMEVSYLYCVNALFQPQILKVRNDVLPEECSTEFIEYKKEEVHS